MMMEIIETMAYVSKEDVQAIRKGLKKTFGKTIKFSVTKEQHSKVNVNILASSIPEITQLVEECGGQDRELQINHFWYTDHYKDNPVVLDVLSKMMGQILYADGGKQYYDRSDSQSDYFDCAFYIHVGIGKWDKPYQAMEVK